MNNEYEYDEHYDEGITFASVRHFFAKGWLRMIIYVAVCLVLVTAVALPIKVFYRSEPVAQTTIEFVYEGVEVGLAPDGSALATDNMISTTVLFSAVEQANLGDTVKDISVLREHMRVEPVLSDEYIKLLQAAANGDEAAAEKLRTYKMFPTRFNVVLSRPSELNLSDDKAKLLLNKTVTAYYNDFRRRYSVTRMFSAEDYVLSQNDTMEFTDAYDLYIENLSAVKEYVNKLISEKPSYVSFANNTTFSTLMSEINILISNYNLFNAHILSDEIWRSPERAKNALLSSKADISIRLDPLKEYISSLTLQIKEIKPNETVTTTDSSGNPVIVEKYPDAYYSYHALLNESNNKLHDYQVKLNSIETRLTALEKITAASDEATTKAATEQLAALEEQTKELIEKVNATIDDYYATTFIASSVRQVEPPVVTRRSLSFNIWVVYAVAVLVGLIVASVVTGVKISKRNHLGAATDKKEESEDEHVA